MVVNHFHLWVTKRHSVLPPGARTIGSEATLARAAYLDGAWKDQLVLYNNAEPPTLSLPDQDWYRIS